MPIRCSRDAVRDLARRSGWSMRVSGAQDLFSYVGGPRGVSAVSVSWLPGGERIKYVHQDGTRKTGGRPMLDGLLRDHV